MQVCLQSQNTLHSHFTSYKIVMVGVAVAGAAAAPLVVGAALGVVEFTQSRFSSNNFLCILYLMDF